MEFEIFTKNGEVRYLSAGLIDEKLKGGEYILTFDLLDGDRLVAIATYTQDTWTEEESWTFEVLDNNIKEINIIGG